jgi:hypothetical protein
MGEQINIEAVLETCWCEGCDPEEWEIGKFCRWCHSKKPQHDPQCPILALTQVITEYKILNGTVITTLSTLIKYIHFLENSDLDDDPAMEPYLNQHL